MPRSRAAWLSQARARRAAYSQSFALPSLRWVLVEEGDPIPNDAIETGVEASGEPLYSIRAWHSGGLHLGKGGRHIFKGGSISWGSQEYSFGTFEVLVGDGRLARWVSISPWPRNTDSDGSASETLSWSPLSLTPLASPSSLPSLDAPKVISTPTLPGNRNFHPPGFFIKPFVAIEGGFEPSAVRNPFTLDRPEDSTPPQESGRQLVAPNTLLFIAQAWYADGWHPGKVEAGDDHCCIGWGGGEVWVKEFRVLSWAV
ncbi:hypothetical protein FRC04_010444 [Tulasnella sp. 424]|nr:hypothetical protein FRC04_010444 [Tulasnella sp. 424]KAG8978624.1 hypothetical protein FRC05_009896 [Tulasnella sp. 425]